MNSRDLDQRDGDEQQQQRALGSSGAVFVDLSSPLAYISAVGPIPTPTMRKEDPDECCRDPAPGFGRDRDLS